MTVATAWISRCRLAFGGLARQGQACPPCYAAGRRRVLEPRAHRNVGPVASEQYPETRIGNQPRWPSGRIRVVRLPQRNPHWSLTACQGQYCPGPIAGLPWPSTESPPYPWSSSHARPLAGAGGGRGARRRRGGITVGVPVGRGHAARPVGRGAALPVPPPRRRPAALPLYDLRQQGLAHADVPAVRRRDETAGVAGCF